MINIIIDYTKDQVDIEGITYDFPMRGHVLERFIFDLLSKAFHSGERLCLEIKDEKGNHTEIDRWNI